MVQILDPGPSLGEQVGGAFGGGLSQGLQMLIQEKMEGMQQKRKLEAIEELLGRRQPTTLVEEEKFTETPLQGGREELSDEQLDVLMGSGIPELTQVAKGLKERRGKQEEREFKREESRYGKNLDEYKKATEKVGTLEGEGLSIQRLQQLNETDKLPKGLGRLNVNVKSGELILPFLANQETQEFIKILNDFTTKAKDSFGARVTNFELDRFMKRLPTLLNTPDGRRRVLRQMEIINDLNTLNHQSLLDVYDQEGGLRKIDFDEASRKAKRDNKEKIGSLKKEFLGLDKGKEKEEKGDRVTVVSPAGKKGSLPKSQLKSALEAGYKRG